MLGKLLKYEFRATERWYLPVYIAIIILAAILRLTMQFSYRMDLLVLPLTLTSILYALVVVVMCVITVVLAIWRFYSSMTGPEAYMTFSLPVSLWLNVAAKALTALIWTLASAVVGCISALICTYYNGFFEDVARGAKSLLLSVMLDLGMDLDKVSLAVIGIFVLFNVIMRLFMVYLSVALGQLVHSHRVLGAFGAYILLNTLLNMISSGAAAVISLNFPDLWKTIQRFLPSVLADNGIMIGSIIIYACLAALFYSLTCMIFEKKLNLE